MITEKDLYQVLRSCKNNASYAKSKRVNFVQRDERSFDWFIGYEAAMNDVIEHINQILKSEDKGE